FVAGSGSPRSSSGFFSISASTYSASSRFESCSSLIACCNCGVMTRDWPCRSSSRCVSAMRPAYRLPLQREPFAEINPAHVTVADDFGGGAFLQHLSFMDDVGAVDDLQRIAHIVVGDEHADAAILQMH